MELVSSTAFRVLPWEFEGSPYPLYADSTVACQWQGKATVMRLKVRENLLFFAPVGSDKCLFALSSTLAPTAEKGEKWKTQTEALQKHFLRELKREKWGRIVIFPEKTQCQVALLDVRGRGWVRPVFSDQLITSRPAEALQDASHLIYGGQGALRSVLNAQWKRLLDSSSKQKISHEARKRARLEPVWVNGSLVELRKILEAALVLFPMAPPPKRYVPAPRVYTHSVLHHARFDWHKRNIAPELERLGNLLLRLHVCVGQSLSEDGNFFEPYFVVDAEQSSMHERMEALLRLRDMTRGTLIENDVTELLSQLRI